jgi:acetyl-CoA carboxylase biotin carboxyl carrier protein
MDLRKLKTLIDLVAESGISELEVNEGDARVRIVKGPGAGQASPPATAAPAALPAQSVVQVTAPAAEPSAPAAPPAPKGNTVTSPMVGTFYRAPGPDKPPFVEVGQSIKASDPVCVIEAMKLLNEIESGFDGVVQEILVENGQPVEYGQPLFVIA